MVYLDLVMGLNFAVDFLLLLAANRLAGFPAKPGRCAAAAVVGGLYGGICLLPGFLFLGNTLWRLIFLTFMGILSFGFDRSSLRRSILFVLLSMALGGVALGFDRGSSWQLIGAATAVCLMCILGFKDKVGSQQFIPVDIRHNGKQTTMTALQDTGNTLRDPITGESVLIAGPDAANILLGLTSKQLASPAESLTAAPGLRIIPYRSVGQQNGLLLAIRPDQVRIGGRLIRTIVAFTPEPIGNDGYQALAGGIS